MEKRAEEFGYTTESLVEELVKRLQDSKSSASTRTSARAERVAKQEADRGADPDRPNPDSISAIGADAAAKIHKIEDLRGQSDTLDQVIAEIKKAAPVSTTVKSEFEDAVRNAYRDYANSGGP